MVELPDNSNGDQVMMAIEPSVAAQPLEQDDKMEETDNMVITLTIP